jgi:hypothetical protein
MTPAAQPLRNRSFVTLVHCALWLLFCLALAGLGGKGPGLREARSLPASSGGLLTAARLQQLFAANQWPKGPAGTNSLDPFFTRYFNPLRTPPAPPTTRDIELTYLGFYQIADGPKRVMVRLGDAFLVARVGSNLTANLFAANAAILSMTLTNPAGQTNFLPLNAKTQLKVPIP